MRAQAISLFEQAENRGEGGQGEEGTALATPSAETNPVFGPVIFSYTRAQAIEDGVLVDITSWAKESGFTCPVAITRGAYDTTIAVSEAEKALGQSVRGRGHDVLWMFYLACRRANTSELKFSVMVARVGGRDGVKHELVELWAKCHGGDNGEMVMTIMVNGED